MYWKVEALTAKRTPITQIMDGGLEDIKNQAELYGLEILSVRPDYGALLRNLFCHRRLSAAVLAVFFSDFADMQRCGLSVHESMNTLQETTTHTALKNALKKIRNLISDGYSLQEAFEAAKIFPKMVPMTLSAAERTGRIPELLDALAQHFKLTNDNQKKIVGAMVYPLVIFCLLSGLSVFISISLAPELKTFFPTCAHPNLAAEVLIGYADFIKRYWWGIFLGLGGAMVPMKYLWDNYREKFMETVLEIPVTGAFMKNMELAHIFGRMYVYQKSGINIIETIDNMYQASPCYVTAKLLLVRDRLFKGLSLSESFRQDPFFPPFVYQNLTKGEQSGYAPQYFERIARYYDIKTREALAAMTAMVEPLFMVIAAGFLLMIVSAFILPIYASMSKMGIGGV